MYQRRRSKNKFDNRGCMEMDDLTTSIFIFEAGKRGWSVTRANKRQDIDEHWDWLISKDGKEFKVDIKSLKRVDSNKEPDDSMICLEYTNVNGDPGWLRGKADFICFMIKEGLLFVKREDLLAYSKKIVNWDDNPEPSTRNKKPHIIYQRSQWNRKDKIVYIMKKELLSISNTLWRINEQNKS